MATKGQLKDALEAKVNEIVPGHARMDLTTDQKRQFTGFFGEEFGEWIDSLDPAIEPEAGP